MVFVYLREKEPSGRVDTNSKDELCCSKGRAVSNPLVDSGFCQIPFYFEKHHGQHITWLTNLIFLFRTSFVWSLAVFLNRRHEDK